jgi:hypothetical protein
MSDVDELRELLRETAPPERDEVAEVVSVFQRWLFLPDRGALLAVLGTVAANRLDGDPVWLLLVGPPGGGKSELLQAVSTLPNIHPAATLTEAALLSGTPKKEHVDGAKGGLLRAIGDFGIILAKDFGSVLSMNRDARAAVLAALREVYDGSWTRHVGTDGGRTLHWSGKVGLIAGCTPTIDRHHAVMGAMGERFVLFRLPEVDEGQQARQALAHAGREAQMRRELADAVSTLFTRAHRNPRDLEADDVERLVALSTLTVRCRSSVERDGYSREIELIPESEAPTRLIVVLSRLLAGLDSINVEREEAWSVITKAALDRNRTCRTPFARARVRCPVRPRKRSEKTATRPLPLRRARLGQGQEPALLAIPDRACRRDRGAVERWEGSPPARAGCQRPRESGLRAPLSVGRRAQRVVAVRVSARLPGRRSRWA